MLFSDAQRMSLDAVKIALASRRRSGQRGGRLPNHLRSAILALVKNGLAVEDVAGETGVSTKTIAVWLDFSKRDHPELTQSPPRVFTVEPSVSPLPRHAVRLLVGTLEISISTVERV